jgi:hypothetical protein
VRGPRSVSRVTGVSFNTVSKLLVEAGFACAAFHDKAVRGVTSKAVQCDEIWSFSYAKTVMKMTDVVALIDAEAAKVPSLRGPYKKRDAVEISN